MKCPACGGDLDPSGSCPDCGMSINGTGAGNGARGPAARGRNSGNAADRWWRGLTGRSKLAAAGVSFLAVAIVLGAVLAGTLGTGAAAPVPGPGPKPKPVPHPKPVTRGTPLIQQFFTLRVTALSLQLDSVLYQAGLKNTEAGRRLLGVSFSGTSGRAPTDELSGLLADTRDGMLADGGVEEDNDTAAVRYCNQMAAEFTPAYRELEAQAARLKAAAESMLTPAQQRGTRDTLVEANAVAQQSIALSLSAMGLLTDTDPIKLAEARTALDEAGALLQQSKALLDRTKASLGEE